jgi:hypothetical protein
VVQGTRTLVQGTRSEPEKVLISSSQVVENLPETEMEQEEVRITTSPDGVLDPSELAGKGSVRGTESDMENVTRNLKGVPNDIQNVTKNLTRGHNVI